MKLAHLEAAGISAIIIAVADRHGLFRKHGADVELVSVPGTQVPELSADVPMGHIGAPAAVLLAARGHKLKIIASFDTAKLTGCLVVRQDIRTVEALRGKRLGARVPGAALWLHTVQALEQLGLDPTRDGIEIAAVGGRAELMAALHERRIDGAVLSRGQYDEIARDGYEIMLDFAPLDIYGAPDALVILDETLRHSPELPRAVLAAMIEALDIALTSNGERSVLDATKAALAVTDDKAAEQALRELSIAAAREPYPSADRLRATQARMVRVRPEIDTVNVDDVIERAVLNSLAIRNPESHG
jgi:ABC-type nitrate/sulfonate/bicarbonate transport system substrate-binding protein